LVLGMTAAFGLSIFASLAIVKDNVRDCARRGNLGDQVGDQDGKEPGAKLPRLVHFALPYGIAEQRLLDCDLIRGSPAIAAGVTPRRMSPTAPTDLLPPFCLETLLASAFRQVERTRIDLSLPKPTARSRE